MTEEISATCDVTTTPTTNNMEENLRSSEARSPYMKGLWPQLAAVIVVNLLHVCHYQGVHSHVSNVLNDDLYDWYDHLENLDLTHDIVATLSLAVSAYLFQKLSRRTCVYIPCVGYIITCILLQTTNSVVTLHLVQVTRAISVTTSTMTTVIYTSEIAHDDIRGALLMVGDVMFDLTHAVVFSIEQYHVFSFSWFAILPPALVIMCFIFWLPETPVYFLRRNEKEAAQQSMLWLRRGVSPESVSQEMEKIEEVLRTTRSDLSSTTTVFQEITSKRSLKYTGIVLILYLTQHFSGYMSIHTVLTRVPLEHSTWLFHIVYPLVEFTGVLATVIAITICDKRGRRFTLIISTITCTMALIPVAICTHIMDDSVFSSEEIFAIIFSIIYNIGFSIGMQVVITVVVVDIFPPKILNIQLALQGIITLIFNYIQDRFVYNEMWDSIPSAWLFWVNAAVCLAGGVFIFKFLPETKQRPTGILFAERRDDVLLSNIQDNFS